MNFIGRFIRFETSCIHMGLAVKIIVAKLFRYIIQNMSLHLVTKRIGNNNNSCDWRLTLTAWGSTLDVRIVDVGF